jgi:hypothetical protein
LITRPGTTAYKQYQSDKRDSQSTPHNVTPFKTTASLFTNRCENLIKLPPPRQQKN